MNDTPLSNEYTHEIQQRIIQNANVWMMILDASGRVIEWNAAAEEISGYSSDELKGGSDIWKRLYPDSDYRREVSRQINEIISRRSYLENFSTTITTKTGEKKYILWNTRELPQPKDASPLYIGVGVDITEQKKAEERVRLQAIRTQKLLDLNQMKDAPFSEMLSFSLEACLKMTESRYSFIGLMNPDESVMSIHSWSRDVMDECAITDKALDFPITSSGVLGECVRQRAPFLLNDYSAPHPAKHGCPKGHVPINRFLSVPLFDGERIVAVIAVANKEDCYDEGDTDALINLGNHFWELLHRREAEEALKRSEERYRAFFSTSRDCVFITTVDGHFIDFNEEAVRLLGYENREDLMGRPVTDVYADPVERGRHTAFIREHGYSKEYPVRLRKKDGTIIDTLITTVAVRDEKGNITRFQGTIRDVTEQRRAEEELKFSNIILSTQQETSLDGILVVDDTGAVLSYNSRFVEMWNIPPDVLATRLDEDFWQSVLSLLTDPDEFLELIKYLYEHHDLESREEVNLIDGRTFDRYSAPMKGTDGSYYGRVWYFRDITERKLMETALRESQQLFSDIISFLPDPTFVIDRAGKVLSWNRALEHLSGIPAGDILGRGDYEYSTWLYGKRRPILIDLVIRPEMDYAKMGYKDIHREGMTITAETEVTRPHGETMTLSLVASPLIGPDGEITGAIESMRDITRIKETENELAQLNENLEVMVKDRTKELEEEVAARKKAEEAIRTSLDEKVVLLREIHHRVKNNLQIIISLMNLQVRKARDPNLKVLLQETQDRVRAMSHVHEKLYRSEDLARINLSSYINSLVKQLFATHEEAAQKVTLRMEFDPIMIDLNIAIPLGLVLNELVSNILKHAFPGDMAGNVTIRGKTTESEILISVQDDGVGFPPEFDWHETPTLGLHLVTSLIGQLEGTIEEAGAEEGVSFSIVIPREETGGKT